MPKHYKRKPSARQYNTATDEQIKRGLSLIKKGLSTRKAAEKVGVKYVTLWRRSKGKILSSFIVYAFVGIIGLDSALLIV